MATERRMRITVLALLCVTCSQVAAGTKPPRARPVDPKALCAPEEGPCCEVRTPTRLPERDQAAIRATLNAHKGEIHACYDEGRWRRTGATGRIEIRFVIDETGHVA